MIKERQPREISGFYTVVNLQGDSFPLNAYTNPLSKILTGKLEPQGKEVDIHKNKILRNKLRGKHDEDLFIVSNRVAILYVDQGLKKTHSKILKGRRCVRNHFINAIELAYVTEWLLKKYNDYFTNTLREITTGKMDSSLESKVKELFTTNILDPCAYSTLGYTILNVPQNLEIPWTNHVYNQAFREFNIASEIKETLKITETLVTRAEEWNIQVDAMRKIYSEIKDWADKLIPIAGKIYA